MEPLQYAHLPPAARWSPLPMVLASCAYGIFIVLLSGYAVTKLLDFFRDFKVDLPASTLLALQFSRIIWSDYGWVILLPFMFGWPLAVIPFLRAPHEAESRAAIVRATRYLVVIIFFLTAVVAAVAYLAPLIALIQSVSAPQKN